MLPILPMLVCFVCCYNSLSLTADCADDQEITDKNGIGHNSQQLIRAAAPVVMVLITPAHDLLSA